MTLLINKWTIGPILLSVGLMIASFVTVAIHASWAEHLEALVFVVLGGLTVLFTDEMIEHLKEYGIGGVWLAECPKYAKIGGLMTVLISSNVILDIV
ncbi:MAG: hypothetical protein AAGC44_08815 [Planctomycetota bacterium]